jgi:hypothetical protein
MKGKKDQTAAGTPSCRFVIQQIVYVYIALQELIS